MNCIRMGTKSGDENGAQETTRRNFVSFKMPLRLRQFYGSATKLKILICFCLIPTWPDTVKLIFEELEISANCSTTTS